MIIALDHSERAGQGLGVSIRLTAEAAFLKKGRHYLTIIWNDGSGNKQVAVFKLGKDTTTLSSQFPPRRH